VSVRRGAFVALALFALGAGRAPAQGVAAGGTRPGSWMGARLERTFLRLDVLTLDVCFDARTADRLAGLTAGASRVSGAVADSVVRAVLEGDDATARIVFRRDLGLDRFIATAVADQAKAVAAGLLPDSVHRAIAAALPVWFAALASRGIRNGDRLEYEMSSDAIRSVYVAVDGAVLVERTDRGRDRRNSVLAAWLAPGASLRDGLLRSLEPAGAARAGRERSGCPVRPGPGRAGQSDSKRPWKNRSLAGS